MILRCSLCICLKKLRKPQKPPKYESKLLDWNNIPENEWKHTPLNCAWTLISWNERVKVIETCLKWTFNYQNCVRVTAQRQVAPNVSVQIVIGDYHPLLKSLCEALKLYGAFPEPHLNTHYLDILEELTEYLEHKFDWSFLANTHLAVPDLAPDKFSGTNPDQDGESFFQLSEQKVKFAPSDTHGDAGMLSNYTIKKNAPFSSLLRGPPATRPNYKRYYMR